MDSVLAKCPKCCEMSYGITEHGKLVSACCKAPYFTLKMAVVAWMKGRAGRG